MRGVVDQGEPMNRSLLATVGVARGCEMRDKGLLTVIYSGTPPAPLSSLALAFCEKYPKIRIFAKI